MVAVRSVIMSVFAALTRRRRAVYTTLVTALLVMSVTGCPDGGGSNGTDNGGSDDTVGNSVGCSAGSRGGAMTLPTTVRTVTYSNTSATEITLVWRDPADSVDYTGIRMSAVPAAGDLAMPMMIPMHSRRIKISGLGADTCYLFTLASVYAADKSGSNTTIAVKTINPIDEDGDGLIDISTLERLQRVRYNPDGTSYKAADTAEGVRCGIAADNDCDGYELTRNLDFADHTSYSRGSLNGDWRPRNNFGRVFNQADAALGVNVGWDPIGNDNTNAFNTRFEGNEYTISNLYIRREGNVGLFGVTTSNAVIRSVGVLTVALFGTMPTDTIGALVADNSGTIINSSATGSINGDTARLTGVNSGTIVPTVLLSLLVE